jgi:hypothetical protein
VVLVDKKQAVNEGTMTVNKALRAFAGISMAALVVMGVVVVAQPQNQPAQLDDVRSAAARAATDWSVTRNCRLPANGGQIVGNKMTGLGADLSARWSKHSLPPGQQNGLVMGFTTAYLDSLATQTGLPPGSCFISEGAIQSAPFPSVFSDPDSGVLEIDGSEAKAAIYIDGAEKGSIRQAFAVSAGKHRWRTMKCEEDVQIEANETKKVYCSKN